MSRKAWYFTYSSCATRSSTSDSGDWGGMAMSPLSGPRCVGICKRREHFVPTNYRSAGCVISSSVSLAETQGRQQDCYVLSKQPRYSPPPRRLKLMTSGRDCRQIAILGIQSPVEFETQETCEQNIRSDSFENSSLEIRSDLLFLKMCRYISALEFLTRIQLTCMLILYCR